MNKFSRIIISSLFLCVSVVFADIERVSVSSIGEQGNGPSDQNRLSGDGRFVAFTSTASNLVPSDTNAHSDIFVHDRTIGETERVSISSSGEQANDYSKTPSISDDGRFVAFDSRASNLISTDINGREDIFVHDRITGLTELVSVSSNGVQRSGFNPTISGDGRFVAFKSWARKLVPDDTNEAVDIFVHDRLTGQTVRANVSSNGEQQESGIGSTSPIGLSSEGRFVVFESTASKLVPNDTNGRSDIFVHDRNTGVTELVSVSSSGVQGNYDSGSPSISADGRFVVFHSWARNLVPTDSNGVHDVFVHDRVTGITELVSVSSSGEQSNSSSRYSTISGNGRFVVFRYSRGCVCAYVHDRETGLTELVSVPASGDLPNGAILTLNISNDGEIVIFGSGSSNLVPQDTNSFYDVFATENPLATSNNDLITIEKLINNETRETHDSAAKLSTGTLYRQSYKVTNDSPNRIYQVKVFENGNMVCNFYSLNPGQSRQRCDSFKTVLDGEQQMQINVSAKVSGSGETLSSSTDAYYTGLNVNGELRVTHRIDNVNADSLNQAQILDSSQASVSYKVENIGEVELYQVKTYHDPVSPVNSGWSLQCVLGPLKPGQVRYCKRDIDFMDAGLNQAMGRAQGRNAIRSATDVVNASNPTYFIVP